MPTYAFRCPQGHQFDHFFRKMSDAVQTLPCPTCGEPAARQMSGGAGLLFKGSGFYITDYKRNRNNDGAQSDNKPASEKQSEKSTDKPAPTSSGDGSKKSE
jgi:putative FmdB family regulatory protein